MKQGERDSKKRVAFVQLFAEASASVDVPDEIHVVPTGAWEHPVYGEMEITSADIAEFVQNFKDRVRKDLRITAGHDNGMSGGELPAIGWFKELIDRGVKGLYAVVEWTEEGRQLLSDRAYKYFSPEFYEEYSDPETGEKRKHVLVGGALTNMPYFKELDPVVAFSEPGIINQFNEPMDLKTILAKKPEDLTSEEKAFVAEHKSELSDDQKAAFAPVLGEGDDKGGDEGDKANDGDKGQDDEGALGGGDKKVDASEGKQGKVITMSEAEVVALKNAANEGQRAFAEIEKMKLGAEVDKLVVSTSNPTGRVLPKQKDAVVELMRSLSEKQRDQFRNILNNMPKADASIFAEVGDGGQAASDLTGVSKEVDAAVKQEIKASENKLDYAGALKKVFAENPGLKTRYDAALAEGAQA